MRDLQKKIPIIGVFPLNLETMARARFPAEIAALLGCVLVMFVATRPRQPLLFFGARDIGRSVSLAELPSETGLHDEKVAQLFREESEDASEAADYAAADRPLEALRFQKAASKAAAAAEKKAEKEELPAGYHVLKPGHKLPKGAILEPFSPRAFSPRLASGYHLLKPGTKLPKGAKVVSHPPVRMRSGTLRHGTSKKVKGMAASHSGILDDASADLRAAVSRAENDYKDATMQMQALMFQAKLRGYY